jgi:hypothetical protein
MSPDPMLGSAINANPQTWNRYAYALNNPTKYNDPFGLFVWDYSAGGSLTDDELLVTKNEGKDGGIAARQLTFRNNFRGVLKSMWWLSPIYGEEGVDNGVIMMGQFPKPGDANVFPIIGGSGRNKTLTAYVAFDQNANFDNLSIAASHEGSHILDYMNYIDANNYGDAVEALILGNMTHLTSEIGAYSWSVYAAKRANWPNFNLPYDKKDFLIWKRGMLAIDKAVLKQYLSTDPKYKDVLLEEKISQ